MNIIFTIVKVALSTIPLIYKVEILVYVSFQWRNEYLITSHNHLVIVDRLFMSILDMMLRTSHRKGTSTGYGK
jgi:hypothetical protein